MIKANVILDYYKWKNKIKDPDSYFKKKLHKLSKIPYFQKKKQEFSILLTNNKKTLKLNNRFLILRENPGMVKETALSIVL